jgi:hypothetical protein
MVLYGNRRTNPDPCQRSMLGHYCKRVGDAWVCVYCDQTIKSYTGPSILDDAPKGDNNG